LASADQLFSVVDLSQVWASFIGIATKKRGVEFVELCTVALYGMNNLRICEDEASYVLLPLFLGSVSLTFQVLKLFSSTYYIRKEMMSRLKRFGSC
jgi:hypothetical protein